MKTREFFKNNKWPGKVINLTFNNTKRWEAIGRVPKSDYTKTSDTQIEDLNCIDFVESEVSIIGWGF